MLLYINNIFMYWYIRDKGMPSSKYFLAQFIYMTIFLYDYRILRLQFRFISILYRSIIIICNKVYIS